MKSPSPSPALYPTQLNLLLAIVFYANSLVLICDQFLTSYHFLTILVTLTSLTCCYLTIRNCLKINDSFETLYWNFFFLMTAYLSTSGDSTSWNFSRGCYSVLLGFAVLSLYTVYTWIRPCQGQDDQQSSSKCLVPLAVEISFLFVGNGIAIIGRCLVLRESFAWVLVGGVIFFLISILLFYNYYLHSSPKSGEHRN